MDNFIKCSLIFLGNKIQSQLCKFEQIKFKYIREIIFIHISFAIKIFPNCCEITAKIPDWNMVPSSLILTVEKKTRILTQLARKWKFVSKAHNLTLSECIDCQSINQTWLAYDTPVYFILSAIYNTNSQYYTSLILFCFPTQSH